MAVHLALAELSRAAVVNGRAPALSQAGPNRPTVVELDPTRRPNRRQLPQSVADRILAAALELPDLGPRGLAERLRLERYGRVRVSHGTVWRVLKRAGLSRRVARVGAPAAHLAVELGPLATRALQAARAREQARGARSVSKRIGVELVADALYLGRIAGLGPVWQYSIVESACGFAFGRVHAGANTVALTADLVDAVLVPAYRELGVPIRRITTDRGVEFGRAFSEACHRNGIEHRRIAPRSSDFKALVERFEGASLLEHHRLALAGRPADRAPEIDVAFQAWLASYNFARPYRGPRSTGRRPADLFYAARPDLLRAKDRDRVASRALEVPGDEHQIAAPHRDPLSFEMAYMVQLALELSGSDGRHAVDMRDALRSNISRHLDIGFRPAELLGERIGAFHAFLTRPVWLLSRAFVVIFIASMAAGAAFATADALPDDPLHDVKLATEQLRISLARSPESRVAIELAIAGSRLREAVLLEEQGRDASADAAVSAYGEHIALAAATLAEMQPAASAALIGQFRAQVVGQQRSLSPAGTVAVSINGSATGVRTASAAVATAAQVDDAGTDGIASSAALVSANAAASAAAGLTTTPSSAPSTSDAATSPSRDDLQGSAVGPRAPASPNAFFPTVPVQGASVGAAPVEAAPAKVDKKTKEAAKAAEKSAARAQEAATRATKAAEKAALSAKDPKPKK